MPRERVVAKAEGREGEEGQQTRALYQRCIP